MERREYLGALSVGQSPACGVRGAQIQPISLLHPTAKILLPDHAHALTPLLPPSTYSQQQSFQEPPRTTYHGRRRRLSLRHATGPRPAAPQPRRGREHRFPGSLHQGRSTDTERHGEGGERDARRRRTGGDAGDRQGCAGRGSGQKLRTSTPWPPSASPDSSRSGRRWGRSRPSTSFLSCLVCWSLLESGTQDGSHIATLSFSLTGKL